MAIGKLHTVVLDCPDPKALAVFYSELTGLPISRGDDDWYQLEREGDQVAIAFQLAPGHRPPTYPDTTSSQQFHLDIRVGDIDAAEPAVLALGARRLRGEGGTAESGYRVYADPAGHPFCLVW